MTSPTLQPGQVYLIEIVLTGRDYNAIYDILPEIMKLAKEKGLEYDIGSPWIHEPEQPKPASIYEGVAE